jgi:hypothetical protein
MSALGQSLQVLCRRAGCEVRIDPKTDLIPIPNPVATACCARSTTGDPAASFNYLVRQNEPSFTLVFVQSGSVPKAIEFFFDRPADVPPA